jgi:hypothetical protein
VRVSTRALARRFGLVFAAAAVATSLVSAMPGYASAAAIRPAKGTFGSAAQPAFAEPAAMAVDRSTGDLLVIDARAGTVSRYHSDGTPADFSALGINVIDGAGPGDETPQGRFVFAAATEVQVAVDDSGGVTDGDIYVTDAFNGVVDVFESTGSYLGQLSAGYPCGVAVGPGGDVYVGDFNGFVRKFVPSAPATFSNPANFPSSGPCQVAAGVGPSAGYVFAAEFSGPVTKIAAEGPQEGETRYTVAAGENHFLSVDPTTGDVFASSGSQVDEYDVSDPTEAVDVAPALTGANGVLGVALASSGDTYISRAGNENIEVFGAVRGVPVVTTEEASGTQIGSATLHGNVDPEGLQLQDCVFEYGLATESDLGHEVACSPTAADIPPSSSSESVTGALTGLQANTSYRFRLSATVAEFETRGEELEFSTVGPPRITEAVVRNVDQHSATLEATVDPRGAATRTAYRIEWGPTTAYGNVAATGAISSGDGPKAVSGEVSGLAAATTYHYRVVATNDEGGETAGPDQLVETLDSCGFTDGRCLEQVSPVDKGPIASPGQAFTFGTNLQVQAGAQGSALAYTVVFGYPEATVGDGAIYLGRRGSSGWGSEQLSPSNLEPPLLNANNSGVLALSPDLGCGVVASVSPLAADAPASIAEIGGKNLYRRDDSTGSYQTITYLPPVGPPSSAEVGEYEVIGMSPDCRRVVFRTSYRYPGIPSAAGAHDQLYEWDQGTLRALAVIPGPGGLAETVVSEALPGAMDEAPENGVPLGEKSVTSSWRAVSVDGSRSIFTAFSRFGGDSGTRAIFLRDTTDPGVTAGTSPAIDVSQSETSTPNSGNSRYWTASDDGKRIFFTARYGLASNGSSAGASSCANVPQGNFAESSGAGCDLYEYDENAPADERLTDLSPDHSDARGAGVAGVLDTSGDGSYVYFVARGRLGSAGRTEAQNLRAGTYNLYLAHAGALRLVSFLGEEETISSGEARAVVNNVKRWTSRSTPDGTTLVFESSLGIPGGVSMVYLYSSVSGTSVCVSCRRDGRSPFSEHPLVPLIDGQQTNGNSRFIQPTVLTAGGRLYFYSYDPLAVGAVEGDRNLYQWEHGQVSLVATEPPGVPRGPSGEPAAAFFAGVSNDGGDVYFATPQSLLGSDRDGRWDIYDARVGGGFPEPTQPAPPCDATAEGACSSGQSPPPAATAPATSTFTGPANPPVKKKHKHHKRKAHKKRHQKKHKRSKHQVRAGNAGRASGDRRAGK